MTQVPPGTIWCRESVAYPHSFRCGPEAEVIRLQGHAAFRGFIQEHDETQRPGTAFPQTPQQELVSHPAFDHRIEDENVATLQFRPRAEMDFAPRQAAVLNVTNLRTNEMANDRAIEVPQQVGGKDIAMIQNDDDIQPALAVLARDLPSQHRHASGDLAGRIR